MKFKLFKDQNSKLFEYQQAVSTPEVAFAQIDQLHSNYQINSIQGTMHSNQFPAHSTNIESNSKMGAGRHAEKGTVKVSEKTQLESISARLAQLHTLRDEQDEEVAHASPFFNENNEELSEGRKPKPEDCSSFKILEISQESNDENGIIESISGRNHVIGRKTQFGEFKSPKNQINLDSDDKDTDQDAELCNDLNQGQASAAAANS